MIVKHLKLLTLITIFVIGLLAPKNISAQGGISLIRDSEIELYLKEWSADVIEATGLEEGSVNLILVNDDAVNAFVAGGPNIFIYTGLLMRSETPEEVIGVIAHELGHIVAGHLTRSRDALQNASYETIIGTLLGVGVAILSGRGEAAQAVVGASQNYALSKYLAHSRIQESSADQAALSFLEAAEIDTKGLISFLDKLQSDDLLPSSQQSEYYRTHPITRNRISALEKRAEELKPFDYQENLRWNEQHKRMQAKIMGYVNPQQVDWAYEESAKDIDAVTAHAVAAYRLSDEKKALGKVEELLYLEAENPFHQELAGQIYADFGHLKTSKKHYRKAHALRPDDGLIAIAYAHIVLEEAQNDKDLEYAASLLRNAIKYEPRSTRLYRLLATAYGRLEDNPRAKLYLAEEAYLKRNPLDTGRLASLAIRDLEKESAEWHRAKDLIFYANQAKTKKKSK